ncbi:substrate-binding domain-containing protein [Streptomyces halobius]|uniref:Substrate-binding domain-containing protein n=2 Tax=Streptomyces halobius TaxID=2879846 RepID=A0ABY4MH64_9ACTN|nr:substrate-binding domain-containing protein [Streptomyces halobius]UQA97145.1 substrate-binding domain-containing protein [Streptomyces halobius]
MALSLAVPLAACGGGNDDAGAGPESIGLLLPENKASRYETFDRRVISSRISTLCLECKLDYRNAGSQVDIQKRQFDALVKKGVKVIILDPVDSEAAGRWVDAAAKKGVKVVAYDRLVEGDIAAYVSYDNEKIGQLQGQGILDALGSQAAAADVVMLNGSATDPNAPSFKKGAHAVLDGKVHKIIYERSIPEWSSDEAKKQLAKVIKDHGPTGVDAVYSANDGMAGGAAEALASAGLKNVPLGGQDAELPALQRLVSGTQSFTIYKQVRPEAETAAEIAFRLLRGKSIKSLAPTTVDNKSKSGIPAKLFDAQIVTKQNMKETVIRDGAVPASWICTKDFEAACKSLGLLD